MLKKIYILILFILFGFQLVFAGGTSFESAEEISFETMTDSIVGETSVFYKFVGDVGEGFKISSVSISNSDGEPYDGSKGLEFIIYDKDKVSLYDWRVYDSVSTKEYGWCKSFEEGEGLNYIEINYRGGEQFTITSEVEFSETNCEDFESGDIPSDFINAKIIEFGEYVDCCTLMSYNGGADEADMFQISLNKKDKLSLSITPNSESSYNVAFYNQDRVLISEDSSPNDGAILRESITASEDGIFYFKISSDFSSSLDSRYSINLEKSEGVTEEEVQSAYLNLLSLSYKIDRGEKLNENELEKINNYLLILENSDERYFPSGQIEFIRTYIEDKNNVLLDSSSSSKSEASSSFDKNSVPSEVSVDSYDYQDEYGYLDEYDYLSPTATGSLLTIWLVFLIFGMLIVLTTIVLFVVALIKILKSDLSIEMKLLWIAICFFLGIIGCVIYFIFAKKLSNSNSKDYGQLVKTDPRVDQLKPFISEARKTKTDEIIIQELKGAGWPENIINEAMK